jgi:peptide-methionine (S)-S-oxide reductase
MMTEGNREVATLGGGCFWCTEAVFDRLKGVISVESGYAGGRDPHPTYDDVCSGQTGHAEVVQVTFDPAQISYADILRVFFGTHDPTTLNRQGADKGTQYRSVIFYHSEEQRRVAEDVMRDLCDQEVFESPIVTELSPAPTFYMAESYHQEFFARNPGQGYCQVVVAPKVAKFRKEFAGLFRD